MPYKKGGAAEKLAKMRRSLKGKADRLERQLKAGKYGAGKDAEQIRQSIEHFREQARSLYATTSVEGKRTQKSATEIQRALTEGKRAVEESKVDISSQQGRRNYLTQLEINKAGTPISRFSKEDAQIFYRLTMDIWKGSTGNRNNAIMDYLGVSDLELAFELIDAAKWGYLNTTEFSVELSGDEAPELQEKSSGQRKGSPPSFAAYTYFDTGNVIDYLFDDDIMKLFAKYNYSDRKVVDWFVKKKPNVYAREDADIIIRRYHEFK